MMREAGAEIHMDPERVRVLVHEYDPDLADLPIREVGEGWDNWVFRLGDGSLDDDALGDELIVRIPRRFEAVPLLRNELRWLPEVSKFCSLPVSVPVGQLPERSDRPFPVGFYHWVPGETLASSSVADPTLAAQQLGEFVRRLHVASPPGAPSAAIRGAPLATRERALIRHLSMCRDLVEPDSVMGAWDECVSASNHAGPATWVHGDLHSRNVLVAHGLISGVVDFGDMCAGDPAVDLVLAWMVFEGRDRDVFLAESGANDACIKRGMGWAIYIGIALLAHGVGNPENQRIGLETLQRVTGANHG